MEKEFVPYDLALNLKDLGFDNTPCFGVYYSSGDDTLMEFNITDSQYYASKGWANGILAPLWQQAFDFFREEYNIDSYLFNEHYYGYSFNIIQDKFNNHEKGWTYEEARLTCLEKLIEIIQKMEQ